MIIGVLIGLICQWIIILILQNDCNKLRNKLDLLINILDKQSDIKSEFSRDKNLVKVLYKIKD